MPSATVRGRAPSVEDSPPTHPQPLRHLLRAPLERIRVDVGLRTAPGDPESQHSCVLDPVGLFSQPDQAPLSDKDVPSNGSPLGVERVLPVPVPNEVLCVRAPRSLPGQVHERRRSDGVLRVNERDQSRAHVVRVRGRLKEPGCQKVEGPYCGQVPCSRNQVRRREGELRGRRNPGIVLSRTLALIDDSLPEFRDPLLAIPRDLERAQAVVRDGLPEDVGPAAPGFAREPPDQATPRTEPETNPRSLVASCQGDTFNATSTVRAEVRWSAFGQRP